MIELVIQPCLRLDAGGIYVPEYREKVLAIVLGKIVCLVRGKSDRTCVAPRSAPELVNEVSYKDSPSSPYPVTCEPVSL